MFAFIASFTRGGESLAVGAGAPKDEDVFSQYQQLSGAELGKNLFQNTYSEELAAKKNRTIKCGFLINLRRLNYRILMMQPFVSTSFRLTSFLPSIASKASAT